MARGKNKDKDAVAETPAPEATEDTTGEPEVEKVNEAEGDLKVDDNPDEDPQVDPEAEAAATEIAAVEAKASAETEAAELAAAEAAAEAEAAAAKAKLKKVKASDVRKLAVALGESGTGRLKLEVLERLAAKIDDNDNPFPDAEDAATACVLALENSTLQSYRGTVKKIQQGGNE